VVLLLLGGIPIVKCKVREVWLSTDAYPYYGFVARNWETNLNTHVKK
jgi:hypothetical protein